MKTCSNCHQNYADEMDFCPRDATPLPPPLNATQFNISTGLAQRYRILRRIGEGGMGTVFLAEQLGVGNRPVALKVLHHKLLEDPDFLQRFQDEASSTGRIRHQNVVTVYECGQADDGSPYIAMEYLEGESLRQALKRRGSLPLLEAVEILQQAARGLNAAHKLGIVHRDLKPDNIFLTHDDDGQVLVKIVDFGIAKMRESMSHTMTGLAVGTPAYMSVEQASGMRSEELDGRSDIYSLGIVAYEIITGRVPFQADTPLAYLKKHLIEPPASISVTRPDLHISPEIDRAVMKALQKERTDRYATAPDFARALANTVSPKPDDLPETEYAIPNAEPMAPVVAAAVSSTPAQISQPVKVQTVTLAPRRSATFGLIATAVAVVVVVGVVAAAWHVMSGRTGTKPVNSSMATVPPVRPSGSGSETAAELSRRVNAATSRGDLLYQEGRYGNAIAEYQRALKLAGNGGNHVALSTKIRHAMTAEEAEQRDGAWPPPEDARRQARPYTQAELADLLSSYTPPARVANFAQHRGIDFGLTATSETELRRAGGNDELIDTLKRLAPEPPPTDTALHAGPELDRVQELIKRGRFKQALTLIQQSALTGSPEGQRLMGDAYAEGWGLPKDYLRARQWYEKSAAGGNTLAMVRMGLLFEQGWGVPEDYLKARQWFEKSSAAGNGLAMVRIGDLYGRGWGVPKDYTQALLWYEKSAAKGNALAMLRLGNLYERGWGVPRDFERAREWFRKSVEAGNAVARNRLAALPN